MCKKCTCFKKLYEVFNVKKTWSLISIGALGATAMMMYMNNKQAVDKAMKNMKKSGKSAYSKVKAMFE